MAVTIKTIKTVTRALMYVCYAALVAMLAITVYDVIMRYIFNNPSSGVTEWSQMFLITCMTTMAHALVEGRFISVGVLVDRFPKKGNMGFEIGMGIAAFVFFIIVGYQLLLLAQGSTLMREAYFVIKTPKWPMYVILGISFLACALATVAYVVERVKKLNAPAAEQSIFDNPELAFIAEAEAGDKKGGEA